MCADYKNIRLEIRLYARSMNRWWKNLQNDSVAEWMLLTTLGCWGVPNGPFQFMAFMLAILFFAGKLTRLQHGYSFVKLEARIMEHITKATLTCSEHGRLLHRLNKVKKFRRNRNIIFVIRRNWRFLVGYSFMMASSIFYFYSMYSRVLHK